MWRLIILAALFFAVGQWASGSAAAAEPRQIYKIYCAQCHGFGGKGDGTNVTKDFPVSPRDFTNVAEMNKLTDADIRNVILDGGLSAGISPMMPPWGKTLKNHEVEELVKHLRKLCGCKGKQG